MHIAHLCKADTVMVYESRQGESFEKPPSKHRPWTGPQSTGKSSMKATGRHIEATITQRSSSRVSK